MVIICLDFSWAAVLLFCAVAKRLPVPPVSYLWPGDADEEADTVGCCSLRVEHLTFDMEKEEVTFDFLGKDSIRYLNTVKVPRDQATSGHDGMCL